MAITVTAANPKELVNWSSPMVDCLSALEMNGKPCSMWMNLALLPTFLMDPKLSLVSHAKISRPKIMESKMASFGSDWMVLIQINLFMKQGFWYFAEKNAKFRGIFRGKFAEKSADFAGFSRGKSQNSWKNRPISRDFRGKKVKLRGTISWFRGILAEKSQFSKDFRGQILRKIGRFHGKFRGETLPRNNQ